MSEREEFWKQKVNS